MKKGYSYISFLVKDKPDHPLVKALREIDPVRYDEGQIIYASHWATDAGWTWEGYWIAYTLQEAVKNIREGKFGDLPLFKKEGLK